MKLRVPDKSEVRIWSVSQFIPSRESQQESYSLAGEHLAPLAEQQFSRLGFDAALTEQWLDDYRSREGKVLEPESVLARPYAGSLNSLWLGDVGGMNASAVFVDFKPANLATNEIMGNAAAGISKVYIG